MVASIPYIEKVIASFVQATAANCNTPTRKGNVVVITPADAEDVMVTGDLHGHRPNFNAIKKIADLEHHSRRHLILQEVCHGGPTYPSNGGCMSHTLLEDVARLKCQFPQQVHFILSNHELAEVTDYPIHKAQKMLNLLFRYGLQEVYGPAAGKVREALSSFIRSCPLAVRLPGEVFVCHSVPEQLETRAFDTSVLERQLDWADLEEHSSVFNLVWGRDYRRENADRFARLVAARVLIHGHEPCPEGYKVPNDIQIILDCCNRPATYLILPTNEVLAHSQIVERIQQLP
jgi:hypothetical protein